MLSNEDKLLKEVSLAQNGNEPALAALITKYMPLIRRWAHKASRPGLDYEDAVQEGLIGLFYAIKSYDKTKTASFNTYASVCIQNAVLSAMRAAGRKKHAPLNQSVPIPEEESTPGPEDQAIADEHYSLMMQQVKSLLSPLEKQVMVLFIEGYSYQEIAQKLSKNEKAVENALLRARKKLR